MVVSSFARLSAFARGVVWGLHVAGWSQRDIAKTVRKTDGTAPTFFAAGKAIAAAKKKGSRKWTAKEESAGGRPSKTTTALDKKIKDLVFRYRGRVLVTVAFIKKRLRAARKVTSRTLQRRLCDAGLAWLHRRRKTLVPRMHKASRVAFAKWVLRRHGSTLRRWIYSDGTVFYLARSFAETEDKKRGALGTMMWRQATGSDGLYEDCIGPSAYWKAGRSCTHGQAHCTQIFTSCLLHSVNTSLPRRRRASP